MTDIRLDQDIKQDFFAINCCDGRICSARTSQMTHAVSMGNNWCLRQGEGLNTYLTSTGHRTLKLSKASWHIDICVYVNARLCFSILPIKKSVYMPICIIYILHVKVHVVGFWFDETFTQCAIILKQIHVYRLWDTEYNMQTCDWHRKLDFFASLLARINTEPCPVKYCY